MPSVVKRPEAEDDLLEIFVFIGRKSVRAANRFLRAADQAMEQLAEMPALGGKCESSNTVLSQLRVRTIPRFRNYLILYRPLPDGVEIVRVVFGGRDLESLFEAEE